MPQLLSDRSIRRLREVTRRVLGEPAGQQPAARRRRGVDSQVYALLTDAVSGTPGAYEAEQVAWDGSAWAAVTGGLAWAALYEIESTTGLPTEADATGAGLIVPVWLAPGAEVGWVFHRAASPVWARLTAEVGGGEYQAEQMSGGSGGWAATSDGLAWDGADPRLFEVESTELLPTEADGAGTNVIVPAWREGDAWYFHWPMQKVTVLTDSDGAGNVNYRDVWVWRPGPVTETTEPVGCPNCIDVPPSWDVTIVDAIRVYTGGGVGCTAADHIFGAGTYTLDSRCQFPSGGNCAWYYDHGMINGYHELIWLERSGSTWSLWYTLSTAGTPCGGDVDDITVQSKLAGDSTDACDPSGTYTYDSFVGQAECPSAYDDAGGTETATVVVTP